MVTTKSERLKILLQNGYFPVELPPPFTTRDFARYRNSIKANWPTNSEPNTMPSVFNIPRLGLKRRRLAIVNPISQFFLSELISNNWIEIKSFVNSSNASLDQPFLKGGIERAVPKPDFFRIDLKKIEAAGEFDHILYTDISRFYGTIYTHVIPWALYGKDWSKSNMFTAGFKASLGNQLDVKVRKGMSNQTIGIPIGPDTSRILSEIVAIAVENRYRELSGRSLDSVFRFVDDWFIGFNTPTESEESISHLSRACTEFELELNMEKTAIVDSSKPTLALWPEELRKLAFVSASGARQAKDIQHFFEVAFARSAENVQDNVIEYALKAARSFDVQNQNYTLFESFVLKAARTSRISLPIAAQILINYYKKGAPVNIYRVSKLIHDVVAKALPHGHSFEVAWAFFLARETGVVIDVSNFDGLFEIDNSASVLVFLDLYHRRQVSGPVDFTHWASLMKTQSLYDSNWLLAYEADCKAWLPSSSYPSHVDGDPWFRALKQRKVSFYDPRRSVPSFGDSRRLQISRLRRRSHFSYALLGLGLGTASF